METKICRGVLHPEGVELPIDLFRIKTQKHGRYAYRRGICRKCENSKPRKSNYIYDKEKIKLNHDKYYSTEHGKKKRREHRKLYYLRHPHKKKEVAKRSINNLSDCYVNVCLSLMGVFNSSNEVKKLKREQLKLHRLCRSLKTTQKS